MSWTATWTARRIKTSFPLEICVLQSTVYLVLYRVLHTGVHCWTACCSSESAFFSFLKYSSLCLMVQINKYKRWRWLLLCPVLHLADMAGLQCVQSFMMLIRHTSLKTSEFDVLDIMHNGKKQSQYSSLRFIFTWYPSVLIYPYDGQGTQTQLAFLFDRSAHTDRPDDCVEINTFINTNSVWSMPNFNYKPATAWVHNQSPFLYQDETSPLCACLGSFPDLDAFVVGWFS